MANSDDVVVPISPEDVKTRANAAFADLTHAVNGEDNSSKLARVGLAIASAIPGMGLLGAIGSSWSESEQDYVNKLIHEWLRLQRAEVEEIARTLQEVISRVERNDDSVRKRMESPEYLTLVRKAFRDWSAAESETKRAAIRNLLANAAMTRLVSDDVLKCFLEWIGQFSELHFKVMKIVFELRRPTRADIWRHLHGERVREDSAEADLFKKLVHDLTVGRVMRQHREIDRHGNFVSQRRTTPSRKGQGTSYVSAFDDGKDYELTELGKQFIHYCMNDVVVKIGVAEQA